MNFFYKPADSTIRTQKLTTSFGSIFPFEILQMISLLFIEAIIIREYTTGKSAALTKREIFSVNVLHLTCWKMYNAIDNLDLSLPECKANIVRTIIDTMVFHSVDTVSRRSNWKIDIFQATNRWENFFEIPKVSRCNIVSSKLYDYYTTYYPKLLKVDSAINSDSYEFARVHKYFANDRVHIGWDYNAFDDYLLHNTLFIHYPYSDLERSFDFLSQLGNRSEIIYKTCWIGCHYNKTICLFDKNRQNRELLLCDLLMRIKKHEFVKDEGNNCRVVVATAL